jgi:hypothetical protein
MAVGGFVVAGALAGYRANENYNKKSKTIKICIPGRYFQGSMKGAMNMKICIKQLAYIRTLLFVAFVLTSAVVVGGEPKITYGKFCYNPELKCIILGDENITWDTGSGWTLFFQDFVAHKIPVIPTIGIDVYGKRVITFLYFSRSLNVASITLKNIFYNTIKRNKISSFTRQSGIGGIFGMNVINRANWIIDFQDGSIEATPRKDAVLSGLEPKFSLSYNKRKYPKTTIVIQGMEIKNVLIDSGSSADLALREADIRELNRKVQPVDSATYYSSGLFTDSISKKKYLYKNIVINNYRFDTLVISQDNESSIGIGFFRKFDKVYLNTREKLFLFY